MSKSFAIGHEEEYGENIDKCLTDLALKVGSGVAVGGIFSLLFKRRVWPITLGAGIGLGMSYTTCENRFRSHYKKSNIFTPKDLQPKTTEDLADLGGLSIPSSDTAASNDTPKTATAPASTE